MKDIPIRNWVPFAMAAAFAPAALVLGVPGGVAGHIWLAAGMLVLGFVMFTLGWLGGGVPKFFAASSLWIGPNTAFLVFVAMTLLAGVIFTLALRALCRKLESVPYLPVMLFGFAAAFPLSPMWQVIAGRVHIGA